MYYDGTRKLGCSCNRQYNHTLAYAGKSAIFNSMRSTIAIVFFILLLFVPGTSQQTELKVAGLKDHVTVRRDARWIPYIEARNDADLYFVQGYVTASDRLWQMDLLRRVVRGETAELFGRTTLEEDKRWRRYGFAQVAEEAVRNYPPEMRAILEDYARGVNAYIASLTAETLPIEFRILQYKPRDWTAPDAVIIGKLLAEALSSTYQRDLFRDSIKGIDPQKLADVTSNVTRYDVVLFGKDVETPRALASVADRPRSGAVIAGITERLTTDLTLRARSLARAGFYAEDLAASNNWVISGKRTADGKPILANDPHLAPSAPGIWYIAHLSTPTMRASGVTLPGTPGVVLGHNEHIAWGATNVGPDVQDVFAETFEGTRYKAPEGWEDGVTRTERISVRPNPLSPVTTVETMEVTTTRHGPIIIESQGKRYALKWTALDPKNNEFEAFFRLNRAKDWNDFKNALKTYGGATQNFVYADTKGNIGWYAAGRIPIRRKGDGALPYDGSTTDGDWIAMIPFEELPHLYNPAEGFIMTANQRIVGTAYKYQQVSRDAAPPWRARRLYELLKADTKATMDSTSAAQHDIFSYPLAMFAKDLADSKALGSDNADIVTRWDGMMLPDSRAALFVNEMRNCASAKIAEDNKPLSAAVVRERILFWAVRERSARWLPKTYADFGALINACEAETVASFTKQFGEDREKWTWSRLSAARFPHPLAAAPLIGGQFATPTPPLGGLAQAPNVGSAVSMRHIASPGNWDATRLVIPLGQSGDPRSPHFKDQFESWRTGAPATVPFSQNSIEATARTVLLFSPGK